MKVVVNRCFGGFGLSDKAIEMIMKRKGLNCFRYKQTKYNCRDGVEEYTKCNSFEDDIIGDYYLTKDLGEKIDKIPNEYFWYYGSKLERTDSDLIAVIEEIGEKEASGRFAELEVVEIPDDVNWEIDDYDGIETIHEVHRSW